VLSAFCEAVVDADIPALEDLIAEDFLLVDVASGFVHSRGTISFSDAEGALIEVASRYSHVFQPDGPNWRLVAAQGTPIPNITLRDEDSGEEVRSLSCDLRI
jgi:ketosteroid isomerase-like protein